MASFRRLRYFLANRAGFYRLFLFPIPGTFLFLLKSCFATEAQKHRINHFSVILWQNEIDTLSYT